PIRRIQCSIQMTVQDPLVRFRFGITVFVDGEGVTVALAFFIGELGDKTQLAAITLGASSNYPLLTLVGTVGSRQKNWLIMG
ncbi:MAG: TMEM165/GDT1 family protein, partial [Dissulfuribacterales bacterium]